jgi:hypothetical protein
MGGSAIHPSRGCVRTSRRGPFGGRTRKVNPVATGAPTEHGFRRDTFPRGPVVHEGRPSMVEGNRAEFERQAILVERRSASLSAPPIGTPRPTDASLKVSRQLLHSYTGRARRPAVICGSTKTLKLLAYLARFELTTSAFGAERSIGQTRANEDGCAPPFGAGFFILRAEIDHGEEGIHRAPIWSATSRKIYQGKRWKYGSGNDYPWPKRHISSRR